MLTSQFLLLFSRLSFFFLSFLSSLVLLITSSSFIPIELCRYLSLGKLVNEALVRVKCMFKGLIHLIFPKIVLVSTREGEATGNLSSSLCRAVLFLWKIMKKETNNALIKDIQDAVFEPELMHC